MCRNIVRFYKSYFLPALLDVVGYLGSEEVADLLLVVGVEHVALDELLAS